MTTCKPATFPSLAQELSILQQSQQPYYRSSTSYCLLVYKHSNAKSPAVITLNKMDVKCLSLIFICSSLVTAMCSLSLNVIFFLMKLLQRFSSYCTLFHYVLVPSHCIISLPFVIIVIWLPNSGSQSLTGHYTHMSMNMKHFLKIV